MNDDSRLDCSDMTAEADRLKTLDDQAKCDRLATEVMLYELDDDYTTALFYLDGGRHVFNYEDWDPFHKIEHAILCRKAFLEARPAMLCYIEIAPIDEGAGITVHIHTEMEFHPNGGFGDADTEARATCLAIIAVLDAEKAQK